MHLRPRRPQSPPAGVSEAGTLSRRETLTILSRMFFDVGVSLADCAFVLGISRDRAEVLLREITRGGN